MSRIPIRATLALAAFALSAQADSLILKNGARYNGSFISGDRNSIRFDTGDGSQRRFYVRDIQSLQFGPTSISSSSMTNRSINNRMLPAGTQLSVRSNETIDSDTATEGRLYSAVVDRDVLDASGAVVIPRGSNAQLVIRETSEGGVFGSSQLVLDLQRVTIGGQNYYVETSDVERSSDRGLGANRRTATMVGGGAALGTLLGAIAGGGSGAAIGAIAGAAAGTTAQVLTKGDEVHVPGETVLTFRLDQPVTLQAR